MRTHRYLIVGGGMTGHAAAAAIRELDPDGALCLLSAEADRPYARPPLSKGLWLGKTESSVWLPEVPGLDLVLGRRAVFLDTVRREVRDDAGETHRYENLLLATGGRPRRLPVGGDQVLYYRTLADYRALRDAGSRVAVIGAGFIGSEVAAALAQSGREVDMIFPEGTIGERAYPHDLAEHVTEVFEEREVQLHPHQTVVEVEGLAGRTRLHLSGGGVVEADLVVAGLGIEADTTLAEQAGLRCDNGIVVDAQLRTSAPRVWAAGDVARFPSAALGGDIRVEHEDNALAQGRAAGRSMAGDGRPYTHLPFFYSDLFDLGYEAVGRLDSRLELVSSWKTPFREGVVYYLERDQVKGVLLWGLFGQVEAARGLIQGHRPVERSDLLQAIH